MAINSRAKGARGERLLASALREYGYTEAKRGVQYCGAKGNADVIDALPFIHIECKFVERLSLRDAMAQSIHDAKENEMPAVFHKYNHGEWEVTMRLSDWIKLYQAYELSQSEGT